MKKISRTKCETEESSRVEQESRTTTALSHAEGRRSGDDHRNNHGKVLKYSDTQWHPAGVAASRWQCQPTYTSLWLQTRSRWPNLPACTPTLPENSELCLPNQFCVGTFQKCIYLSILQPVQLTFLNHLLYTIAWAIFPWLLALRQVNDKQICAAWFLGIFSACLVKPLAMDSATWHH